MGKRVRRYGSENLKNWQQAGAVHNATAYSNGNRRQATNVARTVAPTVNRGVG